MKTEFPKITVAIPVLNEEKNIQNCLHSIFTQDYPLSKLEIIVIDNDSVDRTVEIVKKFNVKLIHDSTHDAQYLKMLAFKQATGEFFTYLDADIELRSKSYFRQLLKPLLENKQIVGSFTKMYVAPGDGVLNRFLSFDSLQRDPLFELLSPSIESTITAQKEGYSICTYTSNNIPPAALCLFRISFLKKTEIVRMNKFMDLDNLAILVESGYDKFAYVPQAGIYHHHVFSINQLVWKRFRNISRNYLSDVGHRRYLWINPKNPKDVIKIVAFVVYANLFFPALIRGIIRSIRHRDSAGLLEPLVTLIVTDVTIFSFLQNKAGRKLILNFLRV